MHRALGQIRTRTITCYDLDLQFPSIDDQIVTTLISNKINETMKQLSLSGTGTVIRWRFVVTKPFSDSLFVNFHFSLFLIKMFKNDSIFFSGRVQTISFSLSFSVIVFMQLIVTFTDKFDLTGFTNAWIFLWFLSKFVSGCAIILRKTSDTNAVFHHTRREGCMGAVVHSSSNPQLGFQGQNDQWRLRFDFRYCFHVWRKI